MRKKRIQPAASICQGRDPLQPACAALSVGILLVPRFTLLAFAGFVDALRLAADTSDRSRPLLCRWHVMTTDGRPAKASCGAVIAPDSGLVDPEPFDYLVVVGGTLHEGPAESVAVRRYLHDAAKNGRTLVGLCTGSFVLARAGLMNGRQTCVSWLHLDEFNAEFPHLNAISDRLYLDDRDRITCAGGTSVIHLASMLIDRHCGPGRSQKGLKIMIEDRQRSAATPQPAGNPMFSTGDRLVRRALLRAEQHVGGHLPVSALAAHLGVSVRHLERRFQAALGRTPAKCLGILRLERARVLVLDTGLPMTEIAESCGFASSAHLARAFRMAYGCTPMMYRKRRPESSHRSDESPNHAGLSPWTGGKPSRGPTARR